MSLDAGQDNQEYGYPDEVQDALVGDTKVPVIMINDFQDGKKSGEKAEGYIGICKKVKEALLGLSDRYSNKINLAIHEAQINLFTVDEVGENPKVELIECNYPIRVNGSMKELEALTTDQIKNMIEEQLKRLIEQKEKKKWEPKLSNGEWYVG